MKTLILKIYFLLTGLEGLLAAGFILGTPSEQGEAILLGLTLERLVLLVGVLLIALGALGIALASWFWPSRFAALQQWVEVFASQDWCLAIIALIGFLLLVFGTQIYQFAATSTDLVHQAYFIRLQPVILWVIALIPQTILVLSLLRYGRRVFRREFLWGVLIFCFCLLVWGWLSISGYGFTEETSETGIFHHPNAPILSVQVFLAWGITMVFTALWYGVSKLCQQNKTCYLGGLNKRWPWLRFFHHDLFIGIAIWLVTFILWMEVPLAPTWFVNPPGPPNYVFYPDSDALIYDSIAQNLLAGEGYSEGLQIGWRTNLIERPMLSFGLAVFHAIAGLGYEEIIGLQVAFLAFIPVLVYLLTRSLHSPISGILVAFLIILRERNAIVLGNSITVSHAKLLLSDLPSMLGVLLFMNLFIHWSQKPEQRGLTALLAGGAMGTFMLIRPEISMVVIWVGLGALLVMLRKPWAWLKGMILVIVGILLLVGPWILRDISIDPYSRKSWLLRNSPDTFMLKVFSFVTPDQTSKGSTKDTPNLTGEVTDNLQKQGAGTEKATQGVSRSEAFLNHVVNSGVQSIVYLPISDWPVECVFVDRTPNQNNICYSLTDYVRQTPYWWSGWTGEIPSSSYPSLLVAFFLIAVGFYAVWHHDKWIGFLPLFALIAHTTTFALINRSGGRFFLPVDWVSAFYYGIGLTDISLFFLRWTGGDQLDWLEEKNNHTAFVSLNRKKPWRIGLVLLGIVLVGAALPVAEMLIPEQYTPVEKNSRLETLLHSDALTEDERKVWDSVLASGGEVLYGRALYPRYYPAGKVNINVKIPVEEEISQMLFYLSGPKLGFFAVPTQKWEVDFPHGSDVLMLGCSTDIVSLAIYDPKKGELIDMLWREPLIEKPVTCPLPGE